MSAGVSRLALLIDVFDMPEQLARVLPDLKPRDLVANILAEFREVEWLTGSPADYRLVRAEDRSPLADDLTLVGQLRDSERLILVENEQDLPDGARPLERTIYLREQDAGRTHRITWQPAIIGRRADSLLNNQWLAVDLMTRPTGLRVSRRHIWLTETQGRYYIENPSGNPATLITQSTAAAGRPVTESQQELQPGDVIQLDRSGITLKFLGDRR